MRSVVSLIVTVATSFLMCACDHGDGRQPAEFQGDPAVLEIYELLPPHVSPTSAGYLAEANAQGARGFRLKERIFTSSFGGVHSLYVKDRRSDESLEYVAVVALANQTPEEFLVEAAKKGEDGFIFVGNRGVCRLFSLCGREHWYVRNTTVGEVVSYEVSPAFTEAEFDALVAEANEKGSRGFKFLASWCFGSPCQRVNVYAGSSVRSSAYVYESIGSEVERSPSEDLAERKAQGGRGFLRETGLCIWIGCMNNNAYVRDSASDLKYTYAVIPAPTEQSPEEFLAEINEQGSKGFSYIGRSCPDPECLSRGNLYVMAYRDRSALPFVAGVASLMDRGLNSNVSHGL